MSGHQQHDKSSPPKSFFRTGEKWLKQIGEFLKQPLGVAAAVITTAAALATVGMFFLMREANTTAEKQTRIAQESEKRADTANKLAKEANANSAKQTDIAEKQLRLAEEAEARAKAADARAEAEKKEAANQQSIAEKAKQDKVLADSRLQQKEDENKGLRDQIEKSRNDRASLNSYLAYYKRALDRIQSKLARYKDMPQSGKAPALEGLKSAITDLASFVTQWKKVMLAVSATLDGNIESMTTASATENIEQIASDLRSLQGKLKDLSDTLPELLAAVPQ